MTKVSLVIPTLNAEGDIEGLLNRIYRQTRRPDEVIVVDSSSSDRTVDIVKTFEWVRLISIERSEFNHGLTRDMALRESIGDIVCFMTQDAVPADEFYIENLIAPILNDFRVVVSSGRQLPKDDARRFEQLVREFNYGPESNVRSKADVVTMGIKAYFATDVCSAYRRSAYIELGGFGKTDMSEDMLMAAKAVNAGYSVAYAADAVCIIRITSLQPSSIAGTMQSAVSSRRTGKSLPVAPRSGRAEGSLSLSPASFCTRGTSGNSPLLDSTAAPAFSETAPAVGPQEKKGYSQ